MEYVLTALFTAGVGTTFGERYSDKDKGKDAGVLISP